MNEALKSVREAHQVELVTEKSIYDHNYGVLQRRIKSLEEKNKKLVAENQSLSAAKMELNASKMQLRSMGMQLEALEKKNKKRKILCKDLWDQNKKLKDNINDLITCQICTERFQSAGERIPCKLKCPHIMCKKCATGWLKKVRFAKVSYNL